MVYNSCARYLQLGAVKILSTVGTCKYFWAQIKTRFFKCLVHDHYLSGIKQISNSFTFEDINNKTLFADILAYKPSKVKNIRRIAEAAATQLSTLTLTLTTATLSRLLD